MSTQNTGTLFVVATPIGNLSDITLRALETLKSASVVACEDTRVTKKLLTHFDIKTPTVSVHQHTKVSQLQKIVDRLLSGEDVAYVSDAGTPGVSDPGNKLVAAARDNDITVVPIPGASALAALVSVAGADMQQFQFLGFPPHKKGRETFFTRVAEADMPVVYYDSVHRVQKNLELLHEKKPDAQVIVGRELTKMHEEIKKGSVSDVCEHFGANPDRVKGEFTIVVF